MIAVKRLQSLFWVMLVTVGAVMAYMVSLRVATERNHLSQVERQIVMTKSDIRYLETEFSARASVRQLETWNAEEFRYPAPTVQQYVNGERALASLVGLEANGGTYVAPPVMTAEMTVAPQEEMPIARAAVASPAPAQIRTDLSLIRTASAAELPRPARTVKAEAAPIRIAAAKPEKAAVTKSRTAAPDPVARRAERMAMLDEQLLDDRTLSDLRSRAATERSGKAH